jgi:hypothetical protein
MADLCKNCRRVRWNKKRNRLVVECAGGVECMRLTIPVLRAQLSQSQAEIAALKLVATEAAAMLAETNHGGLTHRRSVSTQLALEAAGVAIPAQCSACPHDRARLKETPGG